MKKGILWAVVCLIATAASSPVFAADFNEGDRVCVNLWKGTGYCGTVERVSKTRLKIQITSINCGGFLGQCNAHSSCSGGQDVGGTGLQEGDFVWTEAWCITSSS